MMDDVIDSVDEKMIMEDVDKHDKSFKSFGMEHVRGIQVFFR